MKNKIYPNKPINHRKSHGFLFLTMISFLVVQACEISTSIPFDLPDYEEELIIHAVASPQSGGRAVIKFSQPMDGYPGEAPDLPVFEAYLIQDGNRMARFNQDSISVIQDNDYSIQTIFLSIPADSLILKNGQSYAMEVRDLVSQKRFESSAVPLPPQPLVEEFEMDCSGSDCRVTASLGAVLDPVYAISVQGRLPDSVLTDDYYVDRNNQVFSTDLFYPEATLWQHQPISSDFTHGYRRHPLDSLATPVDIKVSIAYLSYDIAQLIREIHGTHAIGEDIFQALRPFHSNFHTVDGRVFGVFGLYNEDIRILPL